MTTSLEAITRPGATATSIVRVDEANAWLIFHLDKTIVIQEYRLKGGEWSSYNGMEWDAEVVFAAAAAIAEIAAGVPAPPIANKSLAALIIDEWTTLISKRIVPITDKRLLVVFHHGAEKRSIMLRELARRSGWQIKGYLTFDEASGIEVGKRITAMRR